jgi:hypothetical protein
MLYLGTQPMLSGIRNARNGRDDRAGQSIAVKKFDCIVLNNQITDWRASQWLTFQIWSGVHFIIQ